MNITVTQALGRAIKNLKQGWWICRIKRRRWEPYYLWDPEHTTEATTVRPELLKQLQQLKLVKGEPVNYRDKYWRRSNRIFVATDECKGFRLPPEEFWIPNDRTPR